MELKTKIRYSGYPVMENYPARWDPEAYDRTSRSKGRLVDLDEFGQRVHDQLWQAIQEEFQLPEQPPVFSAADPLAEEQDYHERFMESRLRVYVGREQINDALLAFADGIDLVPCLVTGPSGSGKSAALARFVRDYRHQQPQTLAIPHFIGASPRSTNLRDMLQRFCQVFKARFGFAEDVPEEVAKLSLTFQEFVGKVPADTRVLLVIDALNQLDEADRVQELYWLPTALPPQVKVIVSSISDTLAPAGRGQGEGQSVLEAFRRRKHCPVQLAALNDEEQREIIRQVPSLSAKTLDDDQVRLLLSNPATANPVFLLVALDELRGFAPYERLNERIAAFPHEGDTVTAIFTQVIERLTEEFNENLVETMLTLLASARRGLSERELQELTAPLATSGRGDGGEGSRDGADDLFPVLRQLRPYLLSRAGLIDFYHRNLFKAVRERYLPSEEQQRQAHVRLADYFHAQDYWLESLEDQRARAKRLPPTPRPANVRKVDELPWQLLQAADWQRSEQLLTELAFLEAKAEAGMVFDLAADFSAAIKCMPVHHPQVRILRLLEEALGRDINLTNFIPRHPTTVFQCLWNSCWWYDCSEAGRHYHPPLGGWPSGEPPWHQPERTLSTFMESWRRAKADNTPGFCWLRSLRPPPHRLGKRREGACADPFGLGKAQDPELEGHWPVPLRLAIRDEQRKFLGPLKVVHAAFSPDGQRIATCSYDHTVRIWDSESGVQMHCLLGHDDAVSSIAFSPDGQRLVSGSWDQTVRVWDTDSGAELLCRRIREDEGAVWSVAFCPDGERIVCSAWPNTVRVWDAHNGARLEFTDGSDNTSDGATAMPRFRSRVVKQAFEFETVIQNETTGDAIAWFPAALDEIATDAAGRTWAGSVGNYLCLFTLEVNARPNQTTGPQP